MTTKIIYRSVAISDYQTISGNIDDDGECKQDVG